MLIGQVLALTGRMALVAAGPVSAGMPVIAEYLSDTPAYASLNRLIRVLPLPGQSLAVIHLTPSEGESGITATVLRLDGTVVAEWRAADWLRQAARQMPEDVRLRTNPAQVGQIYSVTLLPQSGQLAVISQHVVPM